jgi:hypothetical protein
MSSERSPVTPIMRGNECIGFVFGRGLSGYEAFDTDKSIGMFPSKTEAVAAVTKKLGKENAEY